MSKQTLIQAINTAACARENCKRSANVEWLERWTDRLAEIERNNLPSGSGFDSGTRIENVTSARVTFSTAFHHMNESGFYDGWTEHNVIVTPMFDGIDIRVTGRDRNDIKDYIAQVFHETLTAEYEWKGE